MEASNTIYTYSLASQDHGTSSSTTSTTIKNTLDILRPQGPTVLPLHRRLQFGHFHDSTVLLSNLANLSTSPALPSNSPWFIAFLDRASRPSTETWFFGSWETPSSTSPSPETQSHIDTILLSLLRTIKSLPLPRSIHQDFLDSLAAQLPSMTDTDSVGYSRAQYVSHAVDPEIMLWGAVHTSTTLMLQRLDYLTGKMVVPNQMFIWDVDELERYDQRPLPEGLRWGELAREHFALVRARTQIPRMESTLAQLGNVAIFEQPTGRPVAWVFAGQDASLTSLHVEEDYRRRGLAKAISVKVMREKMEEFWEAGEKRLAHGCVVQGNRQSDGMCRGLGGRESGQIYWIRVDLKKVQS